MSKRQKKKNRPHKSPKATAQVAAQDTTLAPAEPEDEGTPSVETVDASAPESPAAEGDVSVDAAAGADGTAAASSDDEQPDVEAVPADEDVPAATASEDEGSTDDSSVVTAADDEASAAAEDSDGASVATDEIETAAHADDDSSAPDAADGEGLAPADVEPVADEGAAEASPAVPGDEWGGPEGPMAEVSNEEFAAAWADATATSEGGAAEGDGAVDAQPGEPGADGTPLDGEEIPLEGERLESIVESMLFASDKALGVADLKKLLGEREGKKITEAIESLTARRKGSGIEVVRLSSGWHLRTNAENAPWVSKLLAGKPMRLSRAMMETLAIVAYRQPVTRPEIDDIRGVDCGPVLKTLLERALIRVIGKKEEVGRPMLYGTTPEFLRVFNLRDLTEMPTLREFYDLSTENQAKVESEHGAPPPSATSPKPDVAMGFVARGELPPEPEEDDPLLEEIDRATALAKKALGDAQGPGPDEEPKPEEEAPAAPPPAES